MQTVLLSIHLIVATFLVGIILIQRADGGALSGLGGGGGNLMSGRAAGNLLTRMTAILGATFMITSMTLAIMARQDTVSAKPSLLDTSAVEQTAPEPAKPAPAAPISE